MSDPEKKENNPPNEENIPPTSSFGCSVPGPGSQIGQFRIERELGRGGMGVVYLAHDTKLDRSVAIKSLPPEVMGDDTFRSRLKWRAMVAVCQNSRKKQLFDVFAPFSWRFFEETC